MSERIDKIVEGIGGLSEEDYTSGGLPKVEPLEAITGIAGITAKERDEAWEIYQASLPVEDDAETPEAEAEAEAKAKEEAEAEDKAKEEAEAEKLKARYTVAKGKSVTYLGSIRGPGEAVEVRGFGGGEEALKRFIDAGVIDDNGS